MLMHEKNMYDPYSGLQILLHGVISLPDATSYDKSKYFPSLFIPRGNGMYILHILKHGYCTETKLNLHIYIMKKYRDHTCFFMH